MTREAADLCEILRGEAKRSQLQTNYFRDNQTRLGLLPQDLSRRVKQTYELIERENQLIGVYAGLGPDRFRVERPDQFRQWIELCGSLGGELQALVSKLDEAAVEALSQEAAAGAQAADVEKKDEDLFLQKLSLVVGVAGVLSTLLTNTVVGTPLAIVVALIVVAVLVAFFARARTRSLGSNYWSRNLLAVSALRAVVMGEKRPERSIYSTTYQTLLGTLQGVAIVEHQAELKKYFQQLIDEYEAGRIGSG